MAWFSSGNIVNPSGGQVLLDIIWPTTGIVPVTAIISATLTLSIDILHTDLALNILHTESVSPIASVLNFFPQLFTSAQLLAGDRLRVVNTSLAIGMVSVALHIS